MSAHTITTLWCDRPGCTNRTHVDANTADTARAKARSYYWYYSLDGLDICPRCLA